MLHPRLLGLSAASALAAAPVAAQAQSCEALRAERNDADQRGEALVQDNPGTALVAFGCMAVAKSEYDKRGYAGDAAGTFAVCGGFGCGLTGDYGNCISKGTEIIYQAIRVVAAEQQLRRQGCRL